jgi:hypothetical protein
MSVRGEGTLASNIEMQEQSEIRGRIREVKLVSVESRIVLRALERGEIEKEGSSETLREESVVEV